LKPLDRPVRSIALTAMALLILVVTAASPAAGESQPRTDSNGIIRIIHIGKAWLYGGYPASVWVNDPRLDWYPVPSHAWSMGKEAFRMLRLYLPRSEEILYNDFDVIVEDGMDASHLRPEFHVWMAKAVEDEGLGFLMADDSSSFATSGRHTSWYQYPIGEVLPVSDVASIYYEKHSYTIVPKAEFRDHPLMTNIPWEEIRIWAHNRPDPKPGSTVLAEMSREIVWNRNKPVIVYWDTETGRSVAYVHKWHGTPDFYRWRWGPDVLSHMIYFPARVEIPQDLELVHQIRSLFNTYHYKRSYLISTMDFADKFGANLAPVEMQLGELGDSKEEADRYYIIQELEASYSNMEDLLLEMDRLTNEVLSAKDRALFWIFLIEWLVVSGTSMITGVVLWALMIKRRLYREVKVTRLIES
jgi:hypothetical protein